MEWPPAPTPKRTDLPDRQHPEAAAPRVRSAELRPAPSRGEDPLCNAGITASISGRSVASVSSLDPRRGTSKRSTPSSVMRAPVYWHSIMTPARM